MDLEQIATTLSEHPCYKVLRRLRPRSELAPHPERPLATGIVIDTETTGLDSTTCKIIEIGLVVFEYDPLTAQPIRVADTYSGLEDPGFLISEETTDITGITNAMVAGQRINDQRVIDLVANATIVIAHNAAFDRPFLENRFPVFASVPWACSLQDIDWSAEKFGARTLEYLAYKMGFFFGAHRATEDCQALLEILASPLPVTGCVALKPLLDRLSCSGYTVYALNAPFASKDLLKARQYRWSSEEKVWSRTVAGERAFDEKLAWLKATIYDGRSAAIAVGMTDARSRFSRRAAPRRNQSL